MQQLQRYDFDTCWQYHDQRRNAKLDKKYREEREEHERQKSDKVRQECKELWMKQKAAVEKNASELLTFVLRPEKKCYNHLCNNQVSWEWSGEKNFCAGDRCVQQLLAPGVTHTHKMQMSCIRSELNKYWNNFEKELDSVSNPARDLSFNSPTSVGDIEEEGMFSMEDIMPMDSDEFNLYCNETLIFSIEEIECNNVLN